MRTQSSVIRTAVAVAVLAALATSAGAAPPAPADPPLSREEYDRKIQQLEDAIKDLRKDTRKIEVAEEEKAKLKPIAGYDNGFFLQSPNGDNKINVGGYVHFDGRYFFNTTDAGTSQFLFRRARLDLKGKIFKYYEFKFMPDFAGGQVVIQDAYLNVNYVPWAKLQAGKYKTPFGIERLQSANALMLIERALPNNLVPNRDLGFMLWGQPFYGAIEYQLAILDGVADGGSNNNDVGFSDDKTFAGRVFFLPLKDGPWEFIRGFGFGVAGTYGRRKGAINNAGLPVYRTDGQQTFFSYVSNTPPTADGTAFANGQQSRLSPQGYWYWGPAGLMWEWVQSDNAVKLGTDTSTIRATAWQTQLSWVVTGEDNTYRGTTPARNFDPWKFLDGYWGALEVAGRYAQLGVEQKAFTLGFANPARSARQAKSWAIGVNWYLNKMVRLMLDFDYTTFKGGAANGGDRHKEEVMMSRVQFVF
jgi:phosphate-selective porin OprO and OprP